MNRACYSFNDGLIINNLKTPRELEIQLYSTPLFEIIQTHKGDKENLKMHKAETLCLFRVSF